MVWVGDLVVYVVARDHMFVVGHTREFALDGTELDGFNLHIFLLHAHATLNT